MFPMNSPRRLLRPGLCSVTLRHLPTHQVAALAAEAGLSAIEWGADVHAPPTDLDAVHRALDDTARHGLAIASLGSYVRVGTPGREGDPSTALAAAAALGAPRLRVWAGSVGSADITDAQRDAVVHGLRELAQAAASIGTQVALEFHDGTLTDTVDSTLRLLDDVGCDEVSTYWQPPVGVPSDQALSGLSAVLDRVSAVHAFSWWPRTERLPLGSRPELWRGAMDLLVARGRPTDVLLEFLPGDDAGALANEAATLRHMIEEAER